MWLPVIRMGNQVQVGVFLNELLAIAVGRFIPIEFGHLAMVVDQHLAQGQTSERPEPHRMAASGRGLKSPDEKRPVTLTTSSPRSENYCGRAWAIAWASPWGV